MTDRTISAISFDLDDTLWSFASMVRNAEAALMHFLWQKAPGTRRLITSPAVLSAYRTRTEAERPDLANQLSALRIASIRAVLQDCDADVSLEDSAYLFFLAERRKAQLFDDVLPTLRWLSERMPVVALTNGNGCIHAAGLTKYFRGTVSAAELGIGKPSSRAFEAAAACAAVKVENLLHIGDEFYADVQGALAAGAQAGWIDRTGRASRRQVEGKRFLLLPDLWRLRPHVERRKE